MTDPALETAKPRVSIETSRAERRAKRMQRKAVPRSFFGRVGVRLLGSWAARSGLAWVGVVTLLAVLAPVLASSFPVLWRAPGGSWTSPLLQELTPTDAVLLWLGLSLCVTAWFGSASRPLRFGAALCSAATATIPAWWFVARRSIDAADAARAAGDTDGPPVVWLYALGVVVVLAVLAWLGSMVRRNRGLLVATAVLGVVGGGLMLGLRIEPSLAPVYSEYREAIAEAQAQGEPVPEAVWAPIPYSPNDAMSDYQVREMLAPGAGPSRRVVVDRIVRDVKVLTDDLTPNTDAERDRSVEQTLAWARQRQVDWSQANPRERQRQARIASRIDGLASVQVDGRFHWLGTTASGTDVASRMIHACRIALAIGFVATGIAVAIGIVVGGAMGYFSGWVDLIGMRLVEIFASIPTIFLLITIVAVYGRDLYLMMAVIGLTGWIGYALFVRAEFLKLRNAEYVDAARAGGAGLWRIWLRHMLPNGVTPLLISASFGVAAAIRTEATLSFLGLGLVNEPSWGQMLQRAREGLAGSGAWWIAVFPILAIFLTVFAYNLIGEALRDALDPKSVRAGG